MTMDTAIMVALGLHSTMLVIDTDGWLAQLLFKVPALYSLILLATLLAERFV